MNQPKVMYHPNTPEEACQCAYNMLVYTYMNLQTLQLGLNLQLEALEDICPGIERPDWMPKRKTKKE